MYTRFDSAGCSLRGNLCRELARARPVRSSGNQWPESLCPSFPSLFSSFCHWLVIDWQKRARTDYQPESSIIPTCIATPLYPKPSGVEQSESSPLQRPLCVVNESQEYPHDHYASFLPSVTEHLLNFLSYLYSSINETRFSIDTYILKFRTLPFRTNRASTAYIYLTINLNYQRNDRSTRASYSCKIREI